MNFFEFFRFFLNCFDFFRFFLNFFDFFRFFLDFEKLFEASKNFENRFLVGERSAWVNPKFCPLSNGETNLKILASDFSEKTLSTSRRVPYAIFADLLICC